MKTCTKCKEIKLLTDFGKSKDRHHSWCKLCLNTRNREVYHKDPNRKALVRSLNDRNRERNQMHVLEHLRNNPCACGESNILTLQFDHLSDKNFNISAEIDHCSLKTLIKEIAKCQVLCANCHSIKSAHQLNSWKLKWLAASDSNRDSID